VSDAGAGSSVPSGAGVAAELREHLVDYLVVGGDEWGRVLDCHVPARL
jgi:hypothetical protein